MWKKRGQRLLKSLFLRSMKKGDFLMVTVNGTKEEGKAGLSVADLLAQRAVAVENVVVELNGEIIHRAEFAQTQLKDNDKVELISFVGGGR